MASERVRVGVLGPLVLDTPSGPAQVGGARLRALLARLALDAGRAVRPATLAEALWGEPWGEEAPEDPQRALQSLVSRLRRVLGDPELLTLGPAGYRLAVEPEAVDAVRFERLAREGRDSYARSRHAEAAAILREALGLWRGPALADVREAPFADAEAERFERARLSALEDRIEADLTLGAEPDLVAELESLTAAHPLRERLHAQLIRALALNGRGAEALAAYQRIRDLLADGFGGDPGPHLQQAHLAVLRGASPGPRRSHGNLDVPLTSFVGRDEDVRRVVGLLGRVRLVTLVGPGGAGKTRLANAVGRRLSPSGGVWFVPLAPVAADDVPRVVFDLLRSRREGVPSRPVTREAVPDHLVETLADDDLVLVLDNCEHVIEAVATLAGTLLARCPGLRVLATGRQPLRIDGETLHPVLPLELPEPGASPERTRACAAVRLFHDRAVAVRPDFAPEGGALTAVTEICRRLDGLPLAIELAAARLRALPVEAVAARLDDRFRLLTGGSRTALPRHRTLGAAVAWSWDLLGSDERTLLERLSVVPGAFAEDTAEAVGGLGEVQESLAALVDKSLLHPVESADPVEPRYRVLETIREYGLARLAERGEVEAVQERHAVFLLRLAETADPRLRTSGQLRWLVRLSAERDNLSAAIRWAAESGDAGLAVRFGVALCWFWFLRDHPPESLDLLDRVLQTRGPAEPQARALVVVAHALATIEAVGEPEEAREAFDRIGKALEEASGTHPVLKMARLALAIGAGAPDMPDSPDEGTDPWSRSLTLLVRGVLAMNTGRALEAKHLLSHALTGFEELGERWGLATTMSTLNSAAQRAGESASPVLAERATRHFRELGMPEHTMESEVATALHLAQTGDADGGRRLLTDLLARAGRAGSAESQAQVCLGLARLEWQAGRPGAAREHAEAGLTEAPPGRATPHLTALLLAVLAQVDVAEGVPDEAARRLDHPAVHLTLSWHTPVAASTAVATAAIELCRNRAERAGRLLGAAAVLRGRDDPGDADVRTVERRITAVLGAAGFTAAYAGGAAASRAEAERLVSSVITSAGADRAGQPV